MCNQFFQRIKEVSTADCRITQPTSLCIYVSNSKQAVARRSSQRIRMRPVGSNHSNTTSRKPTRWWRLSSHTWKHKVGNSKIFRINTNHLILFFNFKPMLHSLSFRTSSVCLSTVLLMICGLTSSILPISARRIMANLEKSIRSAKDLTLRSFMRMRAIASHSNSNT